MNTRSAGILENSWVATVLAVSPLVLALIIGLIAAQVAVSSVEVEGAKEAAGAVLSALVWCGAFGVLASAGLMYQLLRSRSACDAEATAQLLSEVVADPRSPSVQALLETITDAALRVEVGRVGERLSQADRRLKQEEDAWTEMQGLLRNLGESLDLGMNSTHELSRSAEDNQAFHHHLQGTIDKLFHGSEQASSSVLEMVTINNEVRENIHSLVLSVQETTSALEEMALSSREVAQNIEELSTATEETAASMNEMDVSISQVETNANETSKLSETVTGDAETGVMAIKQTIGGIDKIKESSRIGADVIGHLGRRISEIGNILNVIDDVAEQTNLLALNAAIIAAQAGEHGRGFAVVADEIKALAERTGSSTKEIADLVKTIQDQSRAAIDVMSKGVEDVEEGVRLGHNAEDALRKIVDSAKRSTLMIHAIAQATVEQAKGSKQVTNAISRIAETVQQIAFSTAEQAQGSEYIMQSAGRMRNITQQVERSADEQNRGGQQLTHAIENIRDGVEKIAEAQKEQSATSQGMGGVIKQFRESTDRANAINGHLHELLQYSKNELDLPSTDSSK